jgi:uncharacterized protein YbbC (DUF1343 family)
VAAAVCLLEAIRAQSGDQFNWLQHDSRYFIDCLAGTDILRKNSAAEYLKLCKKGEKEFIEKRRPYLLY